MPWPRPRRALCFLCVASCESVASSFGVNSVLAAAAAKAGPTANSRAVNLARGGGGAGPHSSGSGGSSVGTASGGGVHDGGGGGGSSGRQGVSVQAVAEVQPVAVPEDLAEAEAVAAAPDVAMEQRESSLSSSSSPRSPPPPRPSLEDGELFVLVSGRP